MISDKLKTPFLRLQIFIEIWASTVSSFVECYKNVYDTRVKVSVVPRMGYHLHEHMKTKM